MVIADGRLYWIADAYTTTDRYPYSQPYGAINYIRNSVKVVIDAYNGTMSFYVFDPADPHHPDLREDLPAHVQAAERDAREPARARALPARTSSARRPRCSPPTT